MSLKIIFFSSIILFGCGNSDENNPTTINNITLLISRGGRQVSWEKRNEFIPDSLSDQVYLFNLDTTGKLKLYCGFGKLTEINVDIKYIDNIDSTKISGSELFKILQLAKSIYKDEEYITNRSPLDSWLVKLEINDKTFIYYLGESLDTLCLDYLEIVEKIVVDSPKEIPSFR